MLAILSNITIEGPFLKGRVAKLCKEKVYTPPGFGAWAQELLDARFGDEIPRAVFVLLDGRSFLEGKLANQTEIEETLDVHIGIIESFAAAHPDIPLFVSSLDVPQWNLLPLSSERLELYAMHSWRMRLEKSHIPVLELAEIAANMGRDAFYSAKMWYMGALPFSMSGEKALANEIHRAWRALMGTRCKCITLDLDFTLWGGVIGEDGTEGIILDGRYLDFQRRLRELKNQGVLLAVLSKNNMEDALAGLRRCDMLLSEDDFVAIKANWRPKSENLRELALELNLGLDSFVFVDDNPIERKEVGMALPGVHIPELPQLPEKYPAFAAWLSREYFPLLRFSDSDVNRTADYQVEKKRKETFAKFDNLDSYLASLNLHLTFRAAAEGDVIRVAQLTQKTNQFNLTTRRYTEGDIRRMLALSEWRVWLAEVEDKFGAYGVTCLCMACLVNTCAFVDTFLMSCRIMGRGIESAFLACVEKEIADAGFLLIEGSFVPTRKNMPVVDFWESNGYELIADSETDRRKYRKHAPFSAVPSQFVTIVKNIRQQ